MGQLFLGEGSLNQIVIRGPLRGISNALAEVKNRVSARRSFGWPLFQADEDWAYESRRDDRVCPVCLGYEYQGPYRGDQIPRLFPLLSREGNPETLPAVVRPNVHRMPQYSYLKGECRCRLILLNPVETVLQRLHMELEEAAQVV